MPPPPLRLASYPSGPRARRITPFRESEETKKLELFIRRVFSGMELYGVGLDHTLVKDETVPFDAWHYFLNADVSE